jgi:hypothetical protein
MKFNSIREYFYKLHNVLYALVLIPLAVFVFIYLEFQNGSIEGHFRQDKPISLFLLIAICIAIVSDWVVALILFSNRLKSLRTVESLGKKLELYYKLTIVRFAIVVMGLIMLAVGLYLTENQIFTALFVCGLVLVSLIWPMPAKVCNDLQLRGDERLMVRHKKEKLY